MTSEELTLEEIQRLFPGASPVTAFACPECRQGKHPNCTAQVLDLTDELVPCPCAMAGHPA